MPQCRKPFPTMPKPAHVSTSLRKWSISRDVCRKMRVSAPVSIQMLAPTNFFFPLMMENLTVVGLMEASNRKTCFVCNIWQMWLPGQNMMSSATKEQFAPSLIEIRWGSKSSDEMPWLENQPSRTISETRSTCWEAFGPRSLTKLPFGVTSAEVAINCREHIPRFFRKGRIKKKNTHWIDYVAESTTRPDPLLWKHQTILVTPLNPPNRILGWKN